MWLCFLPLYRKEAVYGATISGLQCQSELFTVGGLLAMRHTCAVLIVSVLEYSSEFLYH